MTTMTVFQMWMRTLVVGDIHAGLKGLKQVWEKVHPTPEDTFIFPIIESLNGRTLGHTLVQLRVTTLSGNNISFVQSFKRRLLDPVDIFSFWGVVAVIAIRNSDRNQRIGDMWAKTLVVGAETQYCQYCHEQLTLSTKDTIAGEFECPECGKHNEIIRHY